MTWGATSSNSTSLPRTVDQIEDEITVIIASVVGVDFQLSAAQALELSRALAAAATNATAEVDVDK
jgi:hypothetical protein